MATYKEKRGTNVVPIVSAAPDTGVNGEIVYITGEGLASCNNGTWSKVTATVPVFDWTATTQQAKIQASDKEASDQFGHSVAIDGDTVAVGANKEDTGGSDAGAAYIFTRSGTTWSQQAKIVASDAAASDFLGEAIAISGDTVVVGAHGETSGGGSYAGAAYVFTRSGTTWSQQAKLQSSDIAATDMVGISVAIDGDTIVATAYGENDYAGAAYVFTRSGTTWSQQAKLVASDRQSDDIFGVSVGIDGDTVVVGAYNEDTGGSNAGAAYVFTRSGTSWSQQAKIQSSDIQAGDLFGIATAINDDTIVVGARLEDTGGDGVGAAYVFTRSGTTWSQQAKIQASDKQAADWFGNSAGIDGDTLVVGAFHLTGTNLTGAAYVFTRSGTSWTQAKKLLASDAQDGDFFALRVGISGNTIVSGARNEDTGATNAGAAYTFLAG